MNYELKRAFVLSAMAIAIGVAQAPNCRGASPLDDWTWRNPLPQGNDLESVCYGNGRFVAGGGGSILTSTTGNSWSLQTPAPPVRLHAVCFGNGQFVAVGEQGTVLTSNDGTNWSKSTWGTTAWGGVTYGGGRFVAVGSSQAQSYTVLTSDDGSVWTARSIPVPTFATMGWLSDGAHGGDRFVAVGKIEVPGPFIPLYPAAYASADGITWTNLSSPPGLLQRICYGAGQFVATDRIGTTVTMTLTNDTATWGVVSSGADGINCLTYGNGRFLGVTGNSEVVASTNGSSWNAVGRVSENASSLILGIAVGPDEIVAVGNYGEISTSPDGVSWMDRSTGTWAWFSGVAHGNGRFVAVGDAILTSSDGVAWAAQDPGPATHARAVTFGKDQFVTVGPSGAIATSPDGASWIPRASGSVSDLSSVAYWSGQYVAVGAQGTILTSSDGVNWSSRSSGTSNALVNVAGGNSASGAVGFGGTVTTTTDGIVWNSQTLSGAPDLFGIAFGNGQFVAAGGEYNGLIWTSVDGSHWTSRGQRDLYVNAIGYGAGQFLAAGALAAGGGAARTSVDGVTWTRW